ncbi:MAG: VOC family protein [Polyangiaceae bacterium]|nr:VOC family protein [Polyangiaceae bacterium]
MTQGTYRHGHFVWHELMTPDGAGAEKFYGDLLGWKFRHTEIGGGRIYRLIDVNGREQGGILEMPVSEGIPSHWVGYVSVPDVDSAAKVAEAKGGRATCAPMDIPNIGRFAYLLDPEGAGFVVYHDNRGDQAPREMPNIGDFCWDSLTTTNGDRALAFYGAVVGWVRGKFGDAPGLFFAAGEGQDVIADTDAPQDGARSSWTTHVVVQNLDNARAKAESLGAKILAPQIDVPTVGKMCIIADPWGSVISLFEPQMAA